MFCKLIMVSEDNNNKYYEMRQTSDIQFESRYGRVGASPQVKYYHISKWYSTYNSKIKKGYKDITPAITIEKKIEMSNVNDKISELMNVLYSSSKLQMSANYLVDISSVTNTQLKKAKQYLSDAYYYSNTNKNVSDINSALLELYKVLPRKMKNVKDYLISRVSDFSKLYNDELDLLNNLVVQTEIIEDANVYSSLNINIDICDDNDIIIINSLLNKENNCNKNKVSVKKAFKVTNNITDLKFNKYIDNSKNKTTELVWHGSRTENWLSILKNGLIIKPAGAIHTGSAYGKGIYGSTCFDKSCNYTAGSNIFLSIQKFHVGNQYVYKGWYNNNDFELNYDELRKRDYDSTLVLPGNGLLNNEYVIYKEDQTTINYLVWL